MSNEHDDDQLGNSETPIAGSIDDATASDVASGEGAVGSLQEQLNDAQDRLLRSQAEIENVRRRGQREVQEIRRFANQPMLLDLLPVLDNMERAIAAAEQASEASGLLEGVKMVLQQLTAALEKHHCRRVPAVGKEFDPAIHEALANMPSEEYEKGVVSIVNQSGFQLHDRIIRPAQVVVSSGRPEAS